eukprot:PhM_4_TR15334/c0_g1_i1/m.23776
MDIRINRTNISFEQNSSTTTPSSDEKRKKLRMSLRTFPVTLALFVLIVTAVLSASIVLPTTNDIITSTRDLGDVSLRSLHQIVQGNNEVLVGQLMSGLHAGALSAIRSVIDEFEHTARRYNVVATKFQRDGKLFSPELEYTIRQMMYADVAGMPFISYGGFVVSGGMQLYMAASSDIKPLMPGTDRFVFGIYGNGTFFRDYPHLTGYNPDALYLESCPLSANIECNASYSGVASVAGFEIPVMGAPTLTDEYEVMFNQETIGFAKVNRKLIEEYKALWSWETRDAYWSVGSALFTEPDPTTDNLLQAVSLFGFDPTTLSGLLSTLPQTDGQRVFLAAAGYNTSLWAEYGLVGRLLASSHGKVANEQVVGIKYNRFGIYVNETDDGIIKAAGLHIQNTLNNDYLGMNPNITYEFTLDDASWAARYGSKYFMRSAIIITPTGIMWSVVVAVPYDEIMGDVDRNMDAAMAAIDDNNERLDSRYASRQVLLSVLLFVIGVVVLAASYATTVRYTKPLLRLRDEMAHVAVLELEAVDLTRPRSAISEVASMQSSFAKMVQDLKEFRAFVPQAVLAPGSTPHDGTSRGMMATYLTESETNSPADPAMVPDVPSAPVGDAVVCIADFSMPHSVDRDFKLDPDTPTASESEAAPVVDMLSNRKGKDDPRVARLRNTTLKPFSASFMYASMFFRTDTTSPGNPAPLTPSGLPPPTRPGSAGIRELHAQYQAFVATVLTVIDNMDGVVVRIEADRVIGSWNAFRPCMMHEVLACAAAMEAQATLLEAMAPNVGYNFVVTGGQVMVGFVGTKQVRSPVIVGAAVASSQEQLLSLCPVIGGHILVTEHVAQQVKNKFQLIPVEVVVDDTSPLTTTGAAAASGGGVSTPGSSPLASTLYELLPAPVDSAAHQAFESMSVQYMIGFSRLRNMNFEPAMVALRSFLSEHGATAHAQHSSQATRLAALCEHFHRNPDEATRLLGERYSRKYPRWSVFFDYVADLNSVSQNNLSISSSSDCRLASGGVAALSESIDTMPRSSSTAHVADDANAVVALNSCNKYYRSKKILGQGATCRVYLAITDTGTQVAMKVQRVGNRDSPAVRRVLAEIQLMSQLRHDNIVHMLDTALDGDNVILVQEFVAGGTLGSLQESFGALPVKSVQRYLREVLYGMVYLHENDILHRDIKPHNVLLMIDGQAKVADFGAAAKLAAETKHAKFVGTPMYMSPEDARGEPPSKASDVWSLGIMTVQLLTGTVPFDLAHMSSVSNFMARLAAGVKLIYPEKLVKLPLAMAFVEACLTRDPAARPSMETLLGHEFLL